MSYVLQTSKRARATRLTLYSDGRFVVTVPQRMRDGFVEEFLLRKARWIFKKLEYIKRFSDKTFLGGGRREFLKHKDRALAFAEERARYFNARYSFEYKRITIRNQKTRWGSCSKKGGLSFNYRIALLPQRCADYIIVHELCHLREFNHSRKFWELVALSFPDYLEIRKDIKKLCISGF
ncbi:hypothetical protein A3A21_00105 [Candidatus Jorgensenbacteria bacterium RIFCSPLOWO2_01_FULL_45_25b]|uniref:YgjP-like metallopeptidase domain-containing protein n=1 Tax=Candidatus Jorgensenbacteria bacterium RIFCSPLOWO2_01_FULL_45_25b TaxID=1798471 RepID=A0A1F6BT58_9BACT|nr:MAG: hypothetical protein A3A21_00105 [Candidatus Jorgensenbacteria bacterium RIFCSPLOWO2_01_FULL_45_25b]